MNVGETAGKGVIKIAVHGPSASRVRGLDKTRLVTVTARVEQATGRRPNG